MDDLEQAIYEDLEFLYGEALARPTFKGLKQTLAQFRSHHPQLARKPTDSRVSELDSILITYGDMVSAQDEAPLLTLTNFLRQHIANTVSTVHILPFFPYSSDDGFSVVDYKAVDPSLGEWGHIHEIGRHFRLMFDAVINHISAESDWFKGYLLNDSKYRDYFTEVKPGTDLSQVFRPRTLPLLTPVKQMTAAGDYIEKLVWTTFSSDQIDLNYRNPDLLLEIIEILLFYVAQGAQFIRLDAVAFLWKKIGTSCIHLPQTHHIIQLMRKVLDFVAPGVTIITETNVPHEENVSYFGDGTNEAQMIYNFSLPPLTLHAFHTGNVETLSRWADSLSLPGEQVTFFNFLASHDGIGLTPVKGILSPAAIDEMVQKVQALGGFVSQKTNLDGSLSPYELNINFLDALGDPAGKGESQKLIARRFLASQAILLAMQGVPGIYFHSLFGSRGWVEGVNETGRARTINRQKLLLSPLEDELNDSSSLRCAIFRGYHHLIEQRKSSPAFHPFGSQRILFCHEGVFCLLRSSIDESSHTLCLHNVTPDPQELYIDPSHLPFTKKTSLIDLIDKHPFQSSDAKWHIKLEPYQVKWLDGK
jgi:glycosidase